MRICAGDKSHKTSHNSSYYKHILIIEKHRLQPTWVTDALNLWHSEAKYLALIRAVRVKLSYTTITHARLLYSRERGKDRHEPGLAGRTKPCLRVGIRTGTVAHSELKWLSKSRRHLACLKFRRHVTPPAPIPSLPLTYSTPVSTRYPQVSLGCSFSPYIQRWDLWEPASAHRRELVVRRAVLFGWLY